MGRYRDEVNLKTAIMSFINAVLNAGAGEVRPLPFTFGLWVVCEFESFLDQCQREGEKHLLGMTNADIIVF